MGRNRIVVLKYQRVSVVWWRLFTSLKGQTRTCELKLQKKFRNLAIQAHGVIHSPLLKVFKQRLVSNPSEMIQWILHRQVDWMTSKNTSNLDFLITLQEKSICLSSWLRRNIRSLCLLDLGLIFVIISHYSSKFRECGRLSKIAILFSQSSQRLNVKLDSQNCNPIPFGVFDSQFGKALRSFFTKQFNYI